MHAKVVALLLCLSLVETGVNANYGSITAKKGKNSVRCGCWDLEYSCNREQSVKKLDFVRLSKQGCTPAGEELSKMIRDNPRMYKDGPDKYHCHNGRAVVEYGTQDHNNDVCISQELTFLNQLCEKAKACCGPSGPITTNKGKNTVKAGCWTIEYSCNKEQAVKKLDFIRLTRQGHSKASERLNQMISSNPRVYRDGPDKLMRKGSDTVIEYGTHDHEHDECTAPEVEFLTKLYNEALGCCGTDTPDYGPGPTPGPGPGPTPGPGPAPGPDDIEITCHKGKNKVKAGCWDLEYSCNKEQAVKKLDFVRLSKPGCGAAGEKLSKMIRDNPRMYKDGPDKYRCLDGKSVVEYGTQDHDHDVCTEPEIQFLKKLAKKAKSSCSEISVQKGKNTINAGCWKIEFSCNSEQKTKKLDFVRLTREGCHRGAEKLSQMINVNPRMYKDGPDKLMCKHGKTIIEYGTHDHENDVCIDEEISFISQLAKEAPNYCGGGKPDYPVDPPKPDPPKPDPPKPDPPKPVDPPKPDPPKPVDPPKPDPPKPDPPTPAYDLPPPPAPAY